MAGVFGKLPSAGDFIALGLGPGMRAGLDAWVTQHLAAIDADCWPERGILATIPGALLLAVPSCDAAGRMFPLVAVSHVPTDQAGAETWAAVVLPHLDGAVAGALEAAALAAALNPLDPAPRPPMPAPRVWAPGHVPAPPEALARLVQR